MMNEESRRNDTLLIAAVAGCVIAGVAAIALFGGMAAERDARADGAAALAEPLRDRTGSGPVLASTPPMATDPVARDAEVGIPVAPDAVEVETVARCAPAADEGWVAAGTRAWDARSFAAAADCFAEAEAATPGRAWISYMRGLALWKSGSLEPAEAALADAFALDPGCGKCAVNLSRVRNDVGAYEAALDAARAALAIRPDDADGRYLEGRSLRNLGRVDEALTALGEAVRIDPDHGHAENLIGLILLEADVETEALAHLERARDLLPEVAFVRNNLGMTYERLGDRARAVVEYRAAVDLDAGRGPAARHLARIDPDGAIESEILIASAGDRDPDDGGEEGPASAGDGIAIATLAPDRREAPDGSAPGSDRP